MKIKLIAPHQEWEAGISSAETFTIQKVNLPLLSALTPPEHSVKIVDEAFCPDDCDEAYDLVGVTVMTDLVIKAYSIADAYRKCGVPVVLGGIHPTVMPEEALQHADAVIVGEAETVWPQLLQDVQSGSLKKVYRASEFFDLVKLPQPDRKCYPQRHQRGYTPFVVGLETSRGCPFDCSFCTVSKVMGRKLRFRTISDVVREIEHIETSNLFIVDDALGLHPEVSKNLFARMIPLKRHWVGQGPVSMAEDSELLHIMQLSGCKGLLVGFESLNKDVQSRLKKVDPRKVDYAEAMHRFHDSGIAILGAFVFGSDHETSEVFDQTLEFIMKYRLDGVQLRPLVPYPGTRFYRQLLEEKRLIDPHWWLKGYPPGTILFEPKGMSPEELVDGLNRVIKEVYSLNGIFERFFGISPLKRTPIGYNIYAGFNLANRKRYLSSLKTPQPLL